MALHANENQTRTDIFAGVDGETREGEADCGSVGGGSGGRGVRCTRAPPKDDGDIEGRCEDRKTDGRNVRLALEDDRSRLPSRLVVLVQLEHRRLDLVTERLGLVVGDVRRGLLDDDGAALPHYHIAAFRRQRKIGGGGGVFVRFADPVDKIDR